MGKKRKVKNNCGLKKPAQNRSVCAKMRSTSDGKA